MCVTEGPPDYQASDPPRRRWRLLVLILCISVILLCHGLIYRHLLPNQWRGDVGFWPIEWWHGALMLLAYTTATVLLVAKRRLGLLLITTVVGFAPCCAPPLGIAPEFRLRYERHRYLEAARGGAPYGDQHEEIVNGRRLLYWRWMSWGLDNSIGVIYDPRDLFLQGRYDEPDRRNLDFLAFRSVTNGHLGSSRRLGDGLYLVTHI